MSITENKTLSAADKGHVNEAGPAKAPQYVLLPGDPNRVVSMAAQWDADAEIWTLARQQKCAAGTYKGAAIGALSTGIGGPSAEVVLEEILDKGADTFIRVGTTGTIREDVAVGDIIINDAHIRLDGTSNLYVPEAFPAANSYEVTMALVQACENLGLRYHVGTGCTCGSFFTGQCRPAYNGLYPSHLDKMLADLKAAGVLNFEMEGAALSTLCRLYGKRFGMCAVVVAQRCTGEWNEDPEAEKAACLAGAEAVRILTEWDKAKQKAGKRYYFPGL
ncbi:MAG: nucleoside phosphorylase [Firmicutes bacterium]|nr:nucleoside phosphorylase [Bacillota bacterium]